MIWPEQGVAAMKNSMQFILDEEDKIVDVKGKWDQFASENGGECFAAKLRGQSIWDSMSGRETKEQVNRIFSFSRETKKPYKLWYRCDAPGKPRLNLMEVLPEEEGTGLRVSHTEYSSFPEKPESLKGHEIPDQDLVRCSFCCRYYDGHEWIASYSMPWAENTEEVYTVCPDCKKENDIALANAEKSRGPVVSNYDHAFSDLHEKLTDSKKTR